MKRIISCVILTLAFFGMAKAIVVHRVLLKNGTVLNGYIHDVSNGIIVFQSDDASIVADIFGLEVSDKIVKADRLDSVWVDWANKMDAFEGSNDDRTLTLSDITFAGNTQADSKDAKGFAYYLLQKGRVSDVRVLERGAQVKYRELAPNKYSFTWDDVTCVTIDRRSKTALSGIDCVYQLRSGQTFEGQKAGETKNTLSLYMPNGSVRSFNMDDVVKITYRAVNPAQDIFEQSELLDVIGTGTNVYKGIIIEQNYSSSKNSDNYILLQQESGVVQNIKMSQITSTQWEVNPRFAPLTDVILKVGQLMVNRKEFQFVGVIEKDDIMTLDSLCKSNELVVQSNSTPITVEYRVPEGNNVEVYQLVKVTPTTVRKKTAYCFSYKDMVNAIYRPKSVNTSVNHTTKAEYIIDGVGTYALYDTKKHRAVPISVKKKK